VNLKEWKKAESDMEQLLKLEPRNKEAQELLKEARKHLAKEVDTGPKRKGRKVHIEEVEEEVVQEEAGGSASSSAPMPVELPMPSKVVKLKEKGNDLFRRGQYAEAVSHYTTAIETLEKGIIILCMCVGVAHVTNAHYAQPARGTSPQSPLS